MKKLYKIVIIFLVLMTSSGIFGQTASVTWALGNSTQLTFASVGNVSGSNETKSSGPGQFGMSVFDYNADGQRLWEGTAGWIAGTEEVARYLQFDALPASGNNFTATNVSFNYGAAGADNNIASNVYYSTDGWITRTLLNPNPLAYAGSGMSSFAQNVSVTISSGTIFSVRIYSYAVVSSSPMRPTFAVHNSVVISGITSAKRNCIILTTDVVGKWGKSVMLTASLQEPGVAGNIAIPNKLIKFYVNKILVVQDSTNGSGVASIAYTIPQDSVSNSVKVPQDSVAHTITTTFAGDTNYNAQSGTGTLIVVRHVTNLTVQPTTVVYGQPIVFSATLTDNDSDGKGVSSQALKFYYIPQDSISQKYIGTGTTNSNGVASISYTLPQDSVINSISVTFVGDVNYSPKSGTGTFSNTLNGCIMHVTDASSKWGKSILLTARLQGTGAAGNTNLPNKEIKFYQDSVFVNSCKTNSNGEGSILYDIPAIKTRNWIADDTSSTIAVIRVEFAGDVNYVAQSGIGKLTIEKHITNLIVAPTTAGYGHPVVFSATLTDNDNGGKGVSNQELMFYYIPQDSISQKYIGTGTTNSNGVASISYTLPQDSVINSISVSFVGDVNYRSLSRTGKITITSTGVENNQVEIPTKFALLQNYPNPFNPTSTIRYDIPKTGFVNISIYDILGRVVRVLVSEEKVPGYYEIIFNAKDLSSGIYFYSIRSEGFYQIKKMLLIK